MTGRILRIELRQSTAVWAGLLLAAIGAFLLRALNPPYALWMQVVTVQRDMMQLTWPLALAAGAWQACRERRSRVEELVVTTPRPRWRRVQPIAAAMALAAAVGYLLMLVGGAINIEDVGSYFPLGALPVIAIGALAMIGAVWLGLAIGTLLPSPLTAPLLGVVGFAGLSVLPQMFVVSNREPGTFLLLPFLRPREGGFSPQVLSTSANLSQLLWLAAIAATGFALFAAARTRTRLAAVMPAVLGAAVVLPMLPGRVAEAWVPDRDALTLICTEPPQVCVPRISRHALDDLTGPGRQALAILAAKLPSPPTRVVGILRDTVGQSVGGLPADTLPAPVWISQDGPSGGPDDGPLWAILDGAGTLPCPDLAGTPEDPNEEYNVVRMAAAAWLIDRLPPGESNLPSGLAKSSGTVKQVLDVLHALPAEEQQSRVAALRDAELTCAAGDRLEILTGTPGPG
jgi:hypothetical protein